MCACAQQQKNIISSSNTALVQTASEAAEFIIEAGIMPFLRNAVVGFSLQDHVPEGYFESADKALNPWYWRYEFGADSEIIYGKFLRKKLGFCTRRYYPHLINIRRQNRGVQQLFEAGEISKTSFLVMRSLAQGDAVQGVAFREELGLSRSEADAAFAELMNATLLVIVGFECRRGKNQQPYGWPLAVYARPEDEYGLDILKTGCPPQASLEVLVRRIREIAPQATETQIRAFLENPKPSSAKRRRP